jgi:hypothetical protein
MLCDSQEWVRSGWDKRIAPRWDATGESRELRSHMQLRHSSRLQLAPSGCLLHHPNTSVILVLSLCLPEKGYLLEILEEGITICHFTPTPGSPSVSKIRN